MIILGIDPGFDRLGLAVLEKNQKGERVVYSSCFFTERKDSSSTRLACIEGELEKIIKKYSPKIAGIEKVFFNSNQKTATGVAEARGVILSALGKARIPTMEFTPPQIKLAITGYGRAEKIQVAKMVMAILKLKNLPRYDDETDALAVALTTGTSFIHKKL